MLNRQLKRRIRTKICGLTREEDVVAAAKAGADAIGFVFYPPSPRAVTLRDAERLIKAVPPFVTTVGLFVNPLADTVWEVMDLLSLDLLQFHGEESGEFCSQFRCHYLKVIRLPDELGKAQTLFDETVNDHPEAQGFLLDALDPKLHGGTGKRVNWSIIPDLVKDNSVPLILAGGLDSENVGQAIQLVQPYGVDVSSGVELGDPGLKDKELMEAFVVAVNVE